MFNALREHTAKHALTYLLALLLGFASLATAVYDNFWVLTAEDGAKLRWWHWMALGAKCVAPLLATITAYLLKSPLSDPPAPPGVPSKTP